MDTPKDNAPARRDTGALSRGTCSSCGAAIVWIEMWSGSRMPVDAAPKRLVTLSVDCYGEITACYVPHFATCPNAEQHRRKR